jgi:hypothetical protein
MQIKTHTQNGLVIALVLGEDILFTDEQSTLDFMMTLNYETDSCHIAVHDKALPKDFFILCSGLAGQVLQKFINYRFKLAIIGDFSAYTSKPLHDFIYECNCGKDIFFVATEQEALDKLAAM